MKIKLSKQRRHRFRGREKERDGFNAPECCIYILFVRYRLPLQMFTDDLCKKQEKDEFTSLNYRLMVFFVFILFASSFSVSMSLSLSSHMCIVIRPRKHSEKKKNVLRVEKISIFTPYIGDFAFIIEKTNKERESEEKNLSQRVKDIKI